MEEKAAMVVAAAMAVAAAVMQQGDDASIGFTNAVSTSAVIAPVTEA